MNGFPETLQQVPYTARNQPPITNRAPIPFQVTNTNIPGIRLSQARDRVFLQQNLLGGGQTLQIPHRAKISIRIQPLGYRLFGPQRRLPAGCTLAQLAELVALAVNDFINDVTGQAPQGGRRFGPGYLQLEDLVLVELVPVSPASYQPVLLVVPRAQS
ncbi:hypothetical protein PsYK624_030500 [Phanerochaete sordida]|uniref:Uncharacterized protein n=1 Tax=Phanerochaete sordida TaxID=48140 RepID=A0A9P3LAN4_9APHY|nr:hypothetical protein PsYK624_030500 [Phanerochaete sordida]